MYHNATLVDIDININRKTSYKRNIWLYKHGDFEKLNSEIASIDWEFFLFGDNDDIDLACKRFNEKVLQLAENNIPKKLINDRLKRT